MLRSLVLTSVAAVLPLMATSIQPQTPCSSGPLSGFLESSGCSSNGLTFSNFKWSQLGGVTVSPSDVIVSPQVDGAMFGLDFTSTKFFVTGNDTLIYLLDYTIDPPPPVIDRMSLSLRANSPIPPGTATITVQLCAGALFANNCAGGVGQQLRVFDNGPGDTKFFDSVLFPQPVNLVDVRTTVELLANGSVSEITGFTNANTTTSLDTAVPESDTYVLVGSGLALISLGLAARAKFPRLSNH